MFNESSLHAFVFENESISSVIYTIVATDNDAGDAGIVTYVMHDPSGTFNVSNTTGEIILLKSLDRETILSYLINVTASDSAPAPFHFQTTRQMNITIRDVNDNEPVFWDLPTTSSISALETFTEHQIIYTLLATDVDEAENGMVTMSVLETNCTRIALWSNGSFYVNGKHDYL